MKYQIVPVTSFDQNCLLVWCEETNEAALVDPGGNKEILLDIIKKLKINIKKILLTHGHIDHVGDSMALKAHYNVPIFGPNKNDKFLLDNLSFQYLYFGIKNFSTYSISPDFWLEDNDCIYIGNEIFHVIHCPGHSPGHVVFWNKVRKFIIMGDVLFYKNIGRSDLPGGNFKDLIYSIKCKLLPLGDDIFFVPGHGKSSNFGYERLNNIYLK